MVFVPRDHRDRAERKIAPKAANFLAKINSDIRALNSSILILTQKLKFVVRNEKILGRNLVVLNKKIKSIEFAGATNGQSGGAIDSNEIVALRQKLDEQSALLAQVQSDISFVKGTYAKEEELKEVKFVVDAINPLEFLSRKDLEQILAQKPKSKSK